MRHPALDDSLATPNTARVLLRVEDGARVRDHRREKCGFLRGKVNRRFVEVVLRRRFCAVDSIAPLDDVQIKFENPAF